MGEAVLQNWQQIAKGRQQAPFGYMYEANRVLFLLAKSNYANRAVLQEHLEAQGTETFSSYSLRRSLPTLAEMRRVHPDDAEVLGNWTAQGTEIRIRKVRGRLRGESSCRQARAYVGRPPDGPVTGSVAMRHMPLPCGQGRQQGNLSAGS